jgi:peptidoglycan/xylan/chitin deacetylase (PgdA/CDA1 family)
MKIFPNTVINFHEINNYKWMDRVFQLLKRNYNIIPLNEIKEFYYENKPLKNCCHLTFDDGDVSFYNIVFPLLKKHNISASIYVSPMATTERRNFWFQELRDYDKNNLYKVLNDVLNKTAIEVDSIPLGAVLKSLRVDTIWEIIKRYQMVYNISPKPPINMEVWQLKEIHASGLVSVGAHTLTHPILKNESDKKSEEEIKRSVKELCDILNTKIDHFAFPNGTPELDFSNREMNYLSESGVKIAFSTEIKSFNENDNPFSIPRNGVTYGNQSFILFKLISGSKWSTLKRIMKGRQESDYRLKINNDALINDYYILL